MIIGSVGKNFGAGMSGGTAYVHDPNGKFAELCNADVAGDLEPLALEEDILEVKTLLEKHVEFTGSVAAQVRHRLPRRRLPVPLCNPRLTCLNL